MGDQTRLAMLNESLSIVQQDAIRCKLAKDFQIVKLEQELERAMYRIERLLAGKERIKKLEDENEALELKLAYALKNRNLEERKKEAEIEEERNLRMKLEEKLRFVESELNLFKEEWKTWSINSESMIVEKEKEKEEKELVVRKNVLSFYVKRSTKRSSLGKLWLMRTGIVGIQRFLSESGKVKY
jgi:hypothetical protein